VDEPLLWAVASELDLLGAFGVPTEQTSALDDDPTFFWDLAWPCGLLTGIEFHQLTQEAVVRLDALDEDHALRHLGTALARPSLLAVEEPDRYARVVARVGRPPRDWEVWRRDPDGVELRLASGMSERDASCLRDEIVASHPPSEVSISRR
jgi:hypothetical protein